MSIVTMDRFKWLTQYFFLGMDCGLPIVKTFFSLHRLDLSAVPIRQKLVDTVCEYLDCRLVKLGVSEPREEPWVDYFLAPPPNSRRLIIDFNDDLLLRVTVSDDSHDGILLPGDSIELDLNGFLYFREKSGGDFITAAHFKDQITEAIDLLILPYASPRVSGQK